MASAANPRALVVGADRAILFFRGRTPLRIGTLEDFDVLIKPYEKTIKPAERAILLLVWCVTVRACTCAQATQSASARQKACDCVHCDRAA